MWKVLLRFAAVNGVDAVIDCGALLAGASNRWAPPKTLPNQCMCIIYPSSVGDLLPFCSQQGSQVCAGPGRPESHPGRVLL